MISVFFSGLGQRRKCCGRHPGQHRNFRHRPCCCLAIRLKNPEKKNAPVQLLHTDTIQFVTLKKAEDGEYFFVRLFNPTDKEQSAVLHFQDKKEELNFEKYEIKTIRCSCREVIETELQI